MDLAEKLGMAFQLTNIIRDVHEDYAVGRVYLPEEDLARYNVAPADFARGEATLGVRELLRFEADRAWQNYEEGAALLNLIDQDSRGTLWATGAHVQRATGAHRIRGFRRFWRTRAPQQSRKNAVHRQSPFRAPDGREYP